VDRPRIYLEVERETTLGGMEARNLWNLLQEMPELTEKDFCLALKNLVNSADIPAMQRPGYWLPKLDSYLVHHHNTFGRTLMPQSKQRRLSGNGELIPPLSVSERILELLKIQQKTFPPKELDQGEIERWVRDLEPFQIAAIEWSFEELAEEWKILSCAGGYSGSVHLVEPARIGT